MARARPRASRSAAEAFDVGPAGLEQVQLVAPARELPQVQRVGVAGQAAVPGEEPG